MAEDRYEPVSCDYHDQLEVAAMHHQRVTLQFDDGRTEQGRVEDVFTARGGEFLRFATDDGSKVIRLDHIISMKEE
jgi:Rho-binding antiterminator